MSERKPVFDAVRARMGSVKPEWVPIIDGALDQIGFPKDGGGEAWKQHAIPLLHEFEGFAKVLPDGRVQAYPDPGTGGAPWTIGFGSTTDEVGKPIERGAIWTRERAEKRFERDVDRFATQLTTVLGSARTTDRQFAAMLSLMYNIGPANFSSSTLLKKHKAGDYAGATAEFGKWNRAAGKVMAGLTRRRAAEAKLYAS